MGETTDRNALYCNIPNWHEHGYTGKGVNVWNCEGFDKKTDHGYKSRMRILDSAPGATVFSGSVTHKGANKYFAKDPTVHLELDDTGSTVKDIPLEEFLETYNIKVINASLSPAPFSWPGWKTLPGWKELIEKYDLCCVASSANDSDKNKNFDNSACGWWYVGALYQFGPTGEPKRHGYSNGGEGLDFADFTGDWAGTSSSSPWLAGKCALVRQRFPEMNRFEVYDYMKRHCQDLGDPGEDKLFGNGLFILPTIEEDDDVEVTKTKILVNNEVKEVKRILYKNENYIRLRDYDDVLGICKVDYDKEKNLPIVKK